MRLNSVPPNIVNRPDTFGVVGGVSGTQADGPQTPRLSGGVRPLPLAPEGPAPVEREPTTERRQSRRRGDDRRTKQVPVLIDTRVAQRRTQRRRGQDEAPPSIDLEA